MAADAELISSEGFNLKFKNYLRDFYVYQFKERGFDFKIQGTNEPVDVNMDIIDGTYYPDVKRLQYAIKQAAGLEWKKGDLADADKGRIIPKRKNLRVECITVDSRKIECNPFFNLYHLCSESAEKLGTHFALIYMLIVHFKLGDKFVRNDFVPLGKEKIDQLNYCLKWLVSDIDGEINRNEGRIWTELSDDEKQKYALEAIERFLKPNYVKDDDAQYIYDFITKNKMKIVYNGTNFTIEYDECPYIEKGVLFNIAKTHYQIKIKLKQFGNKMQELTRLGIVKTEKRGQRIYYTLSNLFLNDVLVDKEFEKRFAECITFFAQTSTLGEIGMFILNRFSNSVPAHIRYKHNYIKRALNDYNNIDLLYAIKNKFCTMIEYRNASLNDLEYQRILCYPIEIRESVTDGRQYLLYYHPIFRSVSAMRIEFIDSIVLGELPKKEYFDDDMMRARKLIAHTWGTAFDNFQEGNVKTPLETQRVRVIVSFDENEDFIKSRLQREIRNCASLNELDTDEYGKCIEIVAEVTNPWEMLQWLRSYITRVVSVEINGKEFSGFINDVIKTYESYIEPASNVTKKTFSRTGKSLIRDEIPNNFEKKDDMHSLLFNEIFGVSFTKFGEILLKILETNIITFDDKKHLQEEYTSSFSWENAKKRKKQAEGFLNSFLHAEGNNYKSIVTRMNKNDSFSMWDFLPVTSIEAQWLKSILEHPLAKGFLSEKEISSIVEWLGDAELFDINTVVLHDQYIGVEEFYKSSNFGALTRKIMGAIRNKQKVIIRYKSQSGILSNDVYSPVYIEYSKRDNRFRVRAVSKNNIVKTFNLERILDVTILDETYDKVSAEATIEKHLKENECELVIFFNETRNIPDRILTEFSCFKKKCIKWGNERYRMTLFYDKEDKREVLVRLLSYGSLINVLDDSGGVRHELIKRLENQLELTNSMDLVFAADPKEKE